MSEARSVPFGRTLARARLALGAGRGIESLALAGGVAFLAGAMGGRLLGTTAPWIPAAIALLGWRLRRAIPSRSEAARALDRRQGTGDVAASALASGPGVGELCLRSAQARFGSREVASLALPTAPPLAAAGLAACIALAGLALGPVRETPADVKGELAAIETFAASLGAEGRPEGADLAARAAAARRALSRGSEEKPPREEIESMAKKALALAEARRTAEGGAPEAREARSAAGRLLALAVTRGVDSGGGRVEGRGATSRSASDRPDGRPGRTSFLGVQVPPRFQEVVARYFERGD